MRTTFLLLLVALCGAAESRSGPRKLSKRELLVRAKRRWVLSTIELEEEDPGPYPKIISRMFNNMTGENHEFRISGNGVDLEPVNVFSIDSELGTVYALRPIDRETYWKAFHIKFDIYDKWTNQALDRELAFDVEIKDINDNPPTFSQSQMTVDVKENTPEGYLPVQLHITDRDQQNTNNSKITVSVVSQNPKEPKIGVKQINSGLAQLVLSGCFDYDKIKKYEVVVQAKDHGTPSLSSTAVITLNIVDGNTHPPMFKKKNYQGEVIELATKDNVLRISVEDKDTPKTPGWRAKYNFIKGNEEGYYKIETDPNTNDGVLSVIKGKDYERTTLLTLEVEVKNEEPLWVCKEKSTDQASADFSDKAIITMSVIDANDPPEFRKNPVVLYQNEEDNPGKVLLTPEVFDADSALSDIRFVLLEDPANWVSIDGKTGTITTTKKMDRESPFLNGTDIYNITIGAIDNGKPPATGTGTVQIHLKDVNDNKPQLVNNGAIMCINKGNKIMVPAKDEDLPPYSGPFLFSLRDDDKTPGQWKLHPNFGMECGLISQTTLYYGNYSVPLDIQDQQNNIGHVTLEVMVCDCEDRDVCRTKRSITTSLDSAGIGLIVAGLLLFLLLLLLFICQCRRKELKQLPLMWEKEGQTLMKYNQEGGVSECKTEPTLLLTPTNSVAVMDGVKQGSMQRPPIMMKDMGVCNSSTLPWMNSNMTSLGNMSSLGVQRQRDSLRSHRGQTMISTWGTNRTGTYQGASSRPSQYFNLHSNQRIADHIERRLNQINANHADFPGYQPYSYAFEGQGSKCQSLDGVSLKDPGNDLSVLNDLGPRFTTLGEICQEMLKEKKLKH